MVEAAVWAARPEITGEEGQVTAREQLHLSGGRRSTKKLGGAELFFEVNRVNAAVAQVR